MGMAAGCGEVSALWRLNVAVAVARSRKLSPEELLAEIRSAGRREAEGIAAVKAGGDDAGPEGG
jgi:hypothetical protein